MGEDDPPVSLEYIEDPYFPGLDQNATPSLDEVCCGEEDDDDSVHWPLETELYLRSLTLDQLLSVPDEDIENILIDPIHDVDLDDQQRVEAEFVPHSSSDGERFRNHLQSLSRIRKIRFLTRKAIRDIKVTFVDLSKPYFVKISSNDNYKKFLNISSPDSAKSPEQPGSPTGSVESAQDAASELAGMTLEEQELQKSEWSQELARIEEEIVTLRTVLGSKVRRQSELKRKLGISVWKEISEDMNHGIKSVKESDVYTSVESKVGQIAKAVHDAPIYQKTESAFKTTAEKTTSLFGGLSQSVSGKISQMKNSDSFRSFEERVGATLENVKTKVSTSRSNSVQSFDTYHDNSRPSTVPQSPSIPEEKPLN